MERPSALADSNGWMYANYLFEKDNKWMRKARGWHTRGQAGGVQVNPVALPGPTRPNERGPNAFKMPIVCLTKKR